MSYYEVEVNDNDCVRIDIEDEFIEDMKDLFVDEKDEETFINLMKKYKGKKVYDVTAHISSVQVHDSDLKDTVIEYLDDNDDLLESRRPIIKAAPLKKTTVEKLNDIIYRFDNIIYKDKAQLDKKELLEIREFLKDILVDG